VTEDLERLVSSVAGLPAGRLVTPVDGGPPRYWLSDGPVSAAVWASWRDRHPETALWPLLLTGLHGEDDRPWVVGEVYPDAMSAPDDLDAADVLAGWWAEVVADGPPWPGLAATGPAVGPPDHFAARYAAHLLGDEPAWLGLVACERGADAPAVVGWSGPANHTNDAGAISAVLRSWEDRFGARLIGLGFDTLYVSVAAPPASAAEALAVAAEHLAFCPDNVRQGAGTLAAYAAQIAGLHGWSFWWD
jgi:hypothetical protein